MNTLKMQLPYLKALTVTTLSLASAAPFTIVYSLSSGVFEVFSSDPNAWQNFGYICILGILGSGIAVMMFNKLIQMTSALFSSSVTYAIPIVAVLCGAYGTVKRFSEPSCGTARDHYRNLPHQQKRNPPRQNREGLLIRSKDCSI